MRQELMRAEQRQPSTHTHTQARTSEHKPKMKHMETKTRGTNRCLPRGNFLEQAHKSPFLEPAIHQLGAFRRIHELIMKNGGPSRKKTTLEGEFFFFFFCRFLCCCHQTASSAPHPLGQTEACAQSAFRRCSPSPPLQFADAPPEQRETRSIDHHHKTQSQPLHFTSLTLLTFKTSETSEDIMWRKIDSRRSEVSVIFVREVKNSKKTKRAEVNSELQSRSWAPSIMFCISEAEMMII